MRNAMALSIVAVAWVIVVQVVSGVLAPDTELGLADAGFDELDAGTNPDLAGQGFHEMLPRSSTVVGASTKQILASPSQQTPTTDATGQTITPGASTTTTLGTGSTNTIGAGGSTTTSGTGTTATTAPGTGTGNFNSAHEAAFIARVNDLRDSVGQGTLTRNSTLDAYARAWAKEMGQAGAFTPTKIDTLLPSWRVVGENIAYGPSVQAIFQALVDSTPHYKNMVDPRFTNIGVGAFVDGNGRIWTAHVFGG
jgi:uncharacterized protein YkwD